MDVIEDDISTEAFYTIECDECWFLSVIHMRQALCAQHRGEVELVHLTPAQLASRRAYKQRKAVVEKQREARSRRFKRNE